MSHKRKGQLTKSPEWQKHLRKYLRRLFWSRERMNERKDIEKQIK
jgi:hypothetical protein